MALFEGLKKVYGKYTLTGEISSNGKYEGRADFVAGEPNIETWQAHLDGKIGIGIIPINEKSLCKFGAIDIDVYEGLDLVSLNNAVQRNKFPLVVCRSKSGGAHLFCFCKEWVPAKLMRRRLQEMAAVLGQGDAEIFPKQVELLVDKGDMGSWINMPYFFSQKTRRFALDENGRPMPLEQFIKYAANRQITSADLSKLDNLTPELLDGGPPCLQRLVQIGFPEGTRNSGLFNLGIYAKKADPDNWKRKIEQYNQEYMNPPLESHEVQAVIASLDKREYNYKCSEQPIVKYCNAVKCRRCKFGVATGSDLPLLSALTLLKTDPPIFFIDVEEGGRLYLTAEELQSPRLFQRVCMQRLLSMPPVPKQEVWRDILQPLFEKATIIDVPQDMTPQGQLMLHLEEFCTSKVQTEEPIGLTVGKVYTTEDYHYFRLKDFQAHLERQGFTELRRNRICLTFRDNGVEHVEMRIGEKFMNLWRTRRYLKISNPIADTIKGLYANEEPY